MKRISNSAAFLSMAALAFTLWSTPVMAQGGPGNAGFGPPDATDGLPPMRWLDTLNLTAEQKAKIDSLRTAQAAELASKREAFQVSRKTLQTLMTSNVNVSELRKAFEEVQKARKELAAGRFESVLAIREILTPEQRQNFGKFAGSGMGGRRGRGRGRGNF